MTNSNTSIYLDSIDWSAMVDPAFDEEDIFF